MPHFSSNPVKCEKKKTRFVPLIALRALFSLELLHLVQHWPRHTLLAWARRPHCGHAVCCSICRSLLVPPTIEVLAARLYRLDVWTMQLVDNAYNNARPVSIRAPPRAVLVKGIRDVSAPNITLPWAYSFSVASPFRVKQYDMHFIRDVTAT